MIKLILPVRMQIEVTTLQFLAMDNGIQKKKKKKKNVNYREEKFQVHKQDNTK